MGLDPDVTLVPDAAEVERLLAPFLIRTVPRSSLGFRRILLARHAKWLWRGARRRMFGWAPGVKRTQAYVRSSYEETYAKLPFGVTFAPPGAEQKPTIATYGSDGLVLRRRALVRPHLVAMARAIERLAPRRVLEVGAGSGANLFVLAARFPETEFVGIELTAEGVAQGRRIIAEPELPKLVADYLPWADFERTAYRRVDLRQGDATRLPFADGSFDLVFTRQALEQMESVRNAALFEIARTTSRDLLLCEPFADFQRTRLQRRYIRAKDYFSLSSAGLSRYGIQRTRVVAGFPQNVEMAVGLVCAQVSG